MLGVELFDPFREFRAVVRAGHPIARIGVVPVGRVSHVTGGQDGAAIFDGDADGFRLGALHFDFIRYGAHQQAVRRGAGSTGNTAHYFRGRVGNTGDGRADGSVVPLVTDDAADRGCGAAQESGVADGGYRGGVEVVGVGEYGAL